MLTMDTKKPAAYPIGAKQGRAQDGEKAAHRRNVAIAKHMLAHGMAPSLIAVVTDLSVAQVKALRDGKADAN